MRKTILIIASLVSLISCSSPAERAARELARRVVPEYAGKIIFKEVSDTAECYSIEAQGRKVLIKGTGTNAMAAGLGRYLSEVCAIDVSWEQVHKTVVPATMSLPDSAICSRALVPQRFFLNYCTFGYTMPWWHWEEWERFIDWMALQGINMPLAITGQEAILQKVWHLHGLTDEQILAWCTGPAYLPWHRMCNIDGVDGPLPQAWIDAQKELQKRILKREHELGMKPVLPAFCGHVPGELKELYPNASITDISGWGGFPPENLPHFLSPQDSLFGVIQKQYLTIQQQEFGSDHIYGMDLFNEVDPPSWDPETLAGIARDAYRSLATCDPEAQWLQMGWMFYYDRKHWTPEIIRAYLQAVPEGKVTLLDYYTENVPVWQLTEGFFGQPWIFCYLGNFGGNTRFAGPFNKESGRIGKALGNGAGISGIGSTLEGFGLNRWFFEYVLSRAWSGTGPDDRWLSGLDRRHSSPEGFWRATADSIYLRGSFSEGVLLCGRPCMEGYHSWRVMHVPPYDNATLVRRWNELIQQPSAGHSWNFDAVSVGTQALGNHFAALRNDFARAYREGNLTRARFAAERIREILSDIADLAACETTFRLDRWLAAAESWGESEEEKEYYRRDAWRIITIWGGHDRLNDYASRLWSGLVSYYYAPRWEIFLQEALECMETGRPFNQGRMDELAGAFEKKMMEEAPQVNDKEPAEDIAELCNRLYLKWFGKPTVLATWNVGTFSKYSDDSFQDVAELIKASGAGMVALNELDSCNRRHNVYQLKELAEVLGGWNYHFVSSFPFAGGAYGNGVITREPIIARHALALPRFDGSEPRSCAVVETERCILASVHLDYTGDTARLEQARVLNDWFSEHYDGYGKPVLFCGDFNSTPDRDVIELLSEQWQLLSGTAPTYPSGEPEKCIDYIFALKSAAPAAAIASKTSGAARNASDHLPVIVTLK